METDNTKCAHCGKPTSFERWGKEQPPEGEICQVCGDWVCPECVEYLDTTPICKKCLKDEQAHEQAATRAWAASES